MGGVANILEELMGDRFRSRYREEPYCSVACVEKSIKEKEHSSKSSQSEESVLTI